MPYEKGHKKIGGRKKGSKNKATILLEERRGEAYALVDEVLTFVKAEMKSNNRERILKAIDKLSPILPFVLPKLSSVDANVNLTRNNIEVILPDED